MWKDVALCGVSSIFTYFQTQRVCGDIMTMTILNFVLNVVTLTLVVLKKPIKVIDADLR
jgi:hypothetical protein